MIVDDPGTAAVELRDVSYRRQQREIIEGISLRVGRGEHWALLGPNGAGKSTIMGLAAARTHPTSGSVEVLGHRLGRVDMQELRRHLGHVDPRHPLTEPLTILEVVLTGVMGTVSLSMRWEPSHAHLERADSLARLLGLTGRTHLRWDTLSQGERGRALIARALMAEPRLLLLDEPATGLDVAAREQLVETLDLLARSRPALTSVLVTHHLEELPTTTTHAALISGGTLVGAGPIDDVLTSNTVSAAFGHPIDIERRDGRWSARSATTRTLQS